MSQELEHKTNHQCPRCKKEYDCYLRDEYDECPLAYFEPCMDCKLKSIIDRPSYYKYHPEKTEEKEDSTTC